MKSNRLKVGIVLGLAALFLVVSNEVLARDLVSASQSYVSTVKRVAQALSVAGVIAGGLFMQIPGASHFGRQTLTAGVVGSVCAFGAPAILSLLNSIFGGL